MQSKTLKRASIVWNQTRTLTSTSSVAGQDIDLRSDTVTRPCQRMKDAMMKAPLGDDIFRDCPTTIKFER